jgi:hypothetical protein
VAVKLRAPVVSVSPFDAVNSPADVTVPVPDVEIFPLVVILSPAVDGERVEVALLLDKNPTVPEVFVVVIFPEQDKLPFELVIVQPVAPEPPAIAKSPDELTTKSSLACVSFRRVKLELST